MMWLHAEDIVQDLKVIVRYVIEPHPIILSMAACAETK